MTDEEAAIIAIENAVRAETGITQGIDVSMPRIPGEPGDWEAGPRHGLWYMEGPEIRAIEETNAALEQRLCDQAACSAYEGMINLIQVAARAGIDRAGLLDLWREAGDVVFGPE